MAYQGWSNYQTWCVALWIDNVQDDYDDWLDVARSSENTNKMASLLESWHQENRPETSGVYSDLLGHALSMVDWYEVADSLMKTIND